MLAFTISNEERQKIHFLISAFVIALCSLFFRIDARVALLRGPQSSKIYRQGIRIISALWGAAQSDRCAQFHAEKLKS